MVRGMRPQGARAVQLGLTSKATMSFEINKMTFVTPSLLRIRGRGGSGCMPSASKTGSPERFPLAVRFDKS
jgi:hypothetical protein